MLEFEAASVESEIADHRCFVVRIVAEMATMMPEFRI